MVRSKEKTKRGRGSRAAKYKRQASGGVKRRAQQSSGDFDRWTKDDIQSFTPREGQNKIRFLPPTWKDPDHYGLDAWFHYGVGSDGGTYLCPEKMGKGECPVCAEYLRARKEGEEEYAKKLKPKKRVLVYLIDRKDVEKGPQIYSMPWNMDRNFAIASVDEEHGEELVLDDPEEGYDAFFHREGQKDRTKYSGEKIARRPSPLSDDEKEVEEWLAFVEENPIPEILKFYSFEEIERVFEGGGKAKDDEDEEEEEAPVRTRGSRKAGKKKPTDEDEEDEEVKPGRRGKSSKKEIDDEDEELDEDDEDEEEEEDPKSRQSGRRSSARGSRSDDEEEEDEEEEDEDEEEEDEEEEDDEDEEEEEEEQPRARKKTKAVKSGRSRTGRRR